MKDNIELALKDIILAGLKESGLSDFCCFEDIGLEFAPAPGFGDISSNVCMRLAKSAKKAPVAIANVLAEKISKALEKSPLKKYISEIKAQGAGFINFYLNPVFDIS